VGGCCGPHDNVTIDTKRKITKPQGTASRPSYHTFTTQTHRRLTSMVRRCATEPATRPHGPAVAQDTRTLGFRTVPDAISAEQSLMPSGAAANDSRCSLFFPDARARGDGAAAASHLTKLSCRAESPRWSCLAGCHAMACLRVERAKVGYNGRGAPSRGRRRRRRRQGWAGCTYWRGISDGRASQFGRQVRNEVLATSFSHAAS
jgi:hypothetical protein